jgi:hypothetical protein
MTTTLTTRWASLLTRIGWDYTYRGDYPVSGTGAWFDVHGDHPLHVVVVPDATTESDYRKPIPLIDTSGDIDTLLVGAGPFLSRSRHSAGIMSDSGFVPSWDEGLWFRCRECQRICVYHSTMSYEGRPCGHYDGDHHIGSLDDDVISTLWDDAR